MCERKRESGATSVFERKLKFIVLPRQENRRKPKSDVSNFVLASSFTVLIFKIVLSLKFLKGMSKSRF